MGQNFDVSDWSPENMEEAKAALAIYKDAAAKWDADYAKARDDYYYGCEAPCASVDTAVTIITAGWVGDIKYCYCFTWAAACYVGKQEANAKYNVGMMVKNMGVEPGSRMFYIEQCQKLVDAPAKAAQLAKERIMPLYNECAAKIAQVGYDMVAAVDNIDTLIKQFIKEAPAILGGAEADWLLAYEGDQGQFAETTPTSTGTGYRQPKGWVESDIATFMGSADPSSWLYPYFSDSGIWDKTPSRTTGYKFGLLQLKADFQKKLVFDDIGYIAHGDSSNQSIVVPRYNDPAYRFPNDTQGTSAGWYPFQFNTLICNIMYYCMAVKKHMFKKSDLDAMSVAGDMLMYHKITAMNHGASDLAGGAAAAEQYTWGTVNWMMYYGRGRYTAGKKPSPHHGSLPKADFPAIAANYLEEDMYADAGNSKPPITEHTGKWTAVAGGILDNGNYSGIKIDGSNLGRYSPINMCHVLGDTYCGLMTSMWDRNVYNSSGTPGSSGAKVTTLAGEVGRSSTAGALAGAIGDRAAQAGEMVAHYFGQIKSHLEIITAGSEAIYECDKKVDKEYVAVKAEVGEMDGLGENILALIVDEYSTMAQDEIIANLNLAKLNIHGGFYGTTAEKVLFREQCFLLSFINIIANYKKNNENRLLTYKAGGSVKGSDIGAASGGFKIKKRVPYYVDPTWSLEPDYIGNACLQLDGNPYGMLNHLTQHPSLPTLWDIRNHELSNLQPYIRLYKVEFDDGGNEREHEIRFDSHMKKEVLDMFKSKSVRGVGVGLQHFNFTYDGSNPFSAKKSIKAQLKIFANTFDELVQDRGGYKYTDLAMKTSNTRSENTSCDINARYIEVNDELSQLNFRLKAVVGWSVPNGEFAAMRDDVKDAIYNSFITLNLTPTVHNFDFDDMGRVTFTLNYLAYAEDFYDATAYNVFANADMTVQRLRRQLGMQHYRKVCEDKQLESLKKEHAAAVDEEQRTSISTLMRQLINRDRIYYINVPYEHVINFLDNGPFAEYNPEGGTGTGGIHGDSFVLSNSQHNTVVAKAVDVTLTEMRDVQKSDGASFSTEDEGQIAAALVAIDPNSNNVSFFYLSDLLDIAMENIELELRELPKKIRVLGGGIDRCTLQDKARQYEKYLQNFKRFRVVLGPVEFVKPRMQNGTMSNFVNFGDVPISVKYFLEWIADRMLRKEETLYSLTRFLNDLLNNLVNDFLNKDDCFRYNIKQKVRVNQAVLTSHSNFSLKSTDPESGGVGGQPLDEFTNLIHNRRTKIKLNVKGTKKPWMFSPRVALNHLPMPALNISGRRGSAIVHPTVREEMNYFVFFAARTMPTELMNGCKHRCTQHTPDSKGAPSQKYVDPGDTSRGIFHYVLGRDRGLIKNIKLSKNNSKGLAEARFEKEGFDGMTQLRVVYDAEIDMYANVHAFPGTYIYIDPAGFAPGTRGMTVDSKPFDLTKLGIGGYFMVVRSKHEFSAGKAKTVIEAKWTNQVDRLADENDQAQMGAGDNSLGYPYKRGCPFTATRPAAANTTQAMPTAPSGFQISDLWTWIGD